MQIRCFHCHKPYALGHEAIVEAIEALQAEGQAHYNAACPHCRRVNRVPRKDLERAAPNWKAEAAQAAEIPSGES